MTAPETRSLFLFGTLLDPGLRAIVAGRDVPGEVARAGGYSARGAAEGDYPVLCPDFAGGVEGLLLREVDVEMLARLDYYEAGFGYVARELSVMSNSGETAAAVYVPEEPAVPSGHVWSLAPWQAEWGALTRLAAVEAMAWFGRIDGAALRRCMPTIRVRADARVRAVAEPMPTEQRQKFSREAVEVLALRRPYAAFFAVEEHDLIHPTFHGGRSAAVSRAAFVIGDAVTVLPYDPATDRVLVIEQFRYGAYVRGDPYPWVLEPIAGRIDPGETPEETAMRESHEEAALRLDQLLKVGSYYPSPGGVSEYVYSFVALADLSGLDGRIGGAAEEHEDIRSHVLSFARLMHLVASGEVDNAPLLLSALWLERERGRGGLA